MQPRPFPQTRNLVGAWLFYFKTSRQRKLLTKWIGNTISFPKDERRRRGYRNVFLESWWVINWVLSDYPKDELINGFSARFENVEYQFFLHLFWAVVTFASELIRGWGIEWSEKAQEGRGLGVSSSLGQFNLVGWQELEGKNMAFFSEQHSMCVCVYRIDNAVFCNLSNVCCLLKLR